MNVNAFFNDHLGIVIESSEREVLRSSHITEDVESTFLKYGMALLILLLNS